MPSPSKVLAFGEFQLDLSQGVLMRQGKAVPIPPKAMVILCALVEEHGRLVEKKELMKRVWPDTFVEEGNLAVNIFILRKTLAEGLKGEDAIETVPRRGYRFIVPVRESVEVPQAMAVAAGGAAIQGAPQLIEFPKAVPISPASIVGGAENGSPAHVGRRPGRGVWKLIAAVGLGIAAGALIWRLAWPPLPRVTQITQLTHFGTADALLTDGSRLYVNQYSGGRYTLVQIPAEGGDPAPIHLPFSNVLLADILPGRSELLVLTFDAWDDPRLPWVVPLVGGSSRRVGISEPDSPIWSPDGQRIAYFGPDGLYIAHADGSGASRVSKTWTTETDAYGLAWSPDGRLLRFTVRNRATGGNSLGEIWSDGSHLRPLLPRRQNANARWGEGQCCGRWTADGRYYIYREAFYPRVSLWALREGHGFFGKFPRDPVEIYSSLLDLAYPVPAPDGKRLYVVGKQPRTELARFDPERRQFVPYLPGVSASLARPSRDGLSVAYVTDPDRCLWRAQADGKDSVQLTFPPMQVFDPVWSPDGKQIAFHALWPGKPGKICLLPAQGGSPQVLLANEQSSEDNPSWSPDGQQLMFSRDWLNAAGNTVKEGIEIMDVKSQHLSEVPNLQDVGSPAWSPDGRYVAAHDPHQLMMFDFKTRHWKGLAAGKFIHGSWWSRDSRYLFYQDRLQGIDQPVYRVRIADGKVEEFTSRRQFLQADVNRYSLVGLSAAGEPLAAVLHANADVYALDVDLP